MTISKDDECRQPPWSPVGARPPLTPSAAEVHARSASLMVTPKGSNHLDIAHDACFAAGRPEQTLLYPPPPTMLKRTFLQTPRPGLDADSRSPRFVNGDGSTPSSSFNGVAGIPFWVDSHPKDCSFPYLKDLLRAHQSEVMMQLQQWIAQHEQRLQATLGTVQDALNMFTEKLEVETSPVLSPLSAQLPLKARLAFGGSPTTTKSWNSQRGWKRSVSLGTLGTWKSERSTTTPETCDGSDSFVAREISDGKLVSDAVGRRPSISSTCSVESTRYMSVEEMRQDCIRKGTLGNLVSASRTRSLDFVDVKCFGCSRRMKCIVNHFFFELTFAALICINSVLLGVEVAVVSSSPTQQVPHVFYYTTVFFAAAFLLELNMRMISEGGIISFLCWSELRGWNWFDMLVVICSLVEVGFNFVLLGGGSQSITRIMRMARMTRLGRVLRIARIVRFISQLRVLVISIMSTLQTLLWALFLLLIIIYVFAVLLAQATAEHFSENANYDRENLVGNEHLLEHYWGSLHAAMYTLFMSVAGGVSWEAAVFAVAEVHWIWAAFFTCFIAFSSFALINVMTAVFCQHAIESAQRSLDVRWQRMNFEKRKHVELLRTLFKSLEHNKHGTISVKKLQKCWNHEKMQQFLLSMDLAPDDCWTFFTVLDANREADVTAAEFVDGCLRLKGHAKAFDMAVMTYELRHLSKQNVAFMNFMQESMTTLLTRVDEEQVSPVYESHVSGLSNGTFK